MRNIKTKWGGNNEHWILSSELLSQSFSKYPKNIRRGKYFPVSFYCQKPFSPKQFISSSFPKFLRPNSHRGRSKCVCYGSQTTPVGQQQSQSSHSIGVKALTSSPLWLQGDSLFAFIFLGAQFLRHIFIQTEMLTFFPDLSTSVISKLVSTFPLLWDALLIILLPSILATTWHGMMGSSMPISYKPLMCVHLRSTDVAREQNIPSSFGLQLSADTTGLSLLSKIWAYKYFLLL